METGAVIVYAAVAVINEKLRIAEMVVLAVAEQDSLLILNGQGLPSPLVLLRQAAVEGSNFTCCSQHFCLLLYRSNCQYRIG